VLGGEACYALLLCCFHDTRSVIRSLFSDIPKRFFWLGRDEVCRVGMGIGGS
jgi:hypothetical protein